MMLQTIESDQDDRTTYPDKGVRISINHHKQTLGLHRPRFSFTPEVSRVLGRGLAYPKVQIEGTFVNGLRIWCSDQDGMAPNISHAGAYSVTVPVRRVRGREAFVGSVDVDFQWERDETGPVLLIPRLPDILLPTAVVDKLPNSQVDTSTIMERADKRLQRDMRKLYEEAVALENEAVIAPEAPEVVPQPPAPETIPGEALQAAPAPSAHAQDLKAALAMVNELVDQLGAEVVLSIDDNGHIQAKRRVIQYIDL